MAPLLHLTTPTAWRAALAVGELAPPSLLPPPQGSGFVHLSTPEQVHLPASALFAGRDDVLALVVDPERLPGALRWEPGAPSDPASMRFPHHYGPLPVRAVLAVAPYRVGDAGPWPVSPRERALAFDPSFARRRAAAVVPVEGGWAVLDTRVPASYEHTCAWVDGVTPDSAAHSAEAVLGAAGVAHRRVVTHDAALATGLAGRGWRREETRVMARATERREVRAPVVEVGREVVERAWRRAWRVDLPGIADADLEQLVVREGLADPVLRVVELGVVEGGEAVASAQLRLDGGTAALESVMVDPSVRGRGLGDALVDAALDRAAAAGADVLLLSAAADDWPREWYARRGFVDVGGRWEVTRVR